MPLLSLSPQMLASLQTCELSVTSTFPFPLTLIGLVSFQICSILNGFQDSTLYYASVYDWKYAASRTITGTPQFIVNGVVVPDAPSYNFAQWQVFIDGLLGAGHDDV